MSAEKRPAADGFGTNQLVKRQKSDSNINGSNALVAGGGGSALVQVCRTPFPRVGDALLGCPAC